MKIKPPHLLLASSNPFKLTTNLAPLLSKKSKTAIENEINRNVIALFRLGESQFNFARGLKGRDWRQKISRLYYGAYNTQRALRLRSDGHFSTDSSDHKNIDQLPDNFPNMNAYASRLKALREDRNLADYSHDSKRTDLVLTVEFAEQLVEDFISDTRAILKAQGVRI